MNPYERRIIHTAVQEIEGVTSYSVGADAGRRVVIALEEGVKPTHPSKGGYNRGRGGKGGYNRGGNGGKGGNFKKPYNNKRSGGFNRGGNGGASESTGGTSMKKSDFFGTFLGNSKDD